MYSYILTDNTSSLLSHDTNLGGSVQVHPTTYYPVRPPRKCWRTTSPPASHKTEAKSLFHTLEAAVCAARPSIEGGKPSISSAFVMSFSNCFVASNTFSLNFVESSINSCSARYQSQTTTRNSGPNLLLLMILQLLFQLSLALTAAPFKWVLSWLTCSLFLLHCALLQGHHDLYYTKWLPSLFSLEPWGRSWSLPVWTH